MSDYTPAEQPTTPQPMVRYVIADEDGEIMVRNTCPADVLGDITGAVECGEGVLGSTHYVAGGAVVAYSEAQATAKATPHERWFRWSNDSMSWIDQRAFADLQAAKWKEIKAERAAREFGGYTWDGSAFDSDEQSQSRIMGAVQMAVLAAAAQQTFEIVWTLADNSVRTLSGADMVAVGLALGTHVGTQHETARTLRAAIEAATTAEELDAIAWPAT